MTTFRDVLKQYEKECQKSGVYEQAALQYLLELAQVNRMDLYEVMDQEIPESLLVEFEPGMQRILNHEPLQHVLGYSWFYGYKMKVNQSVLIPRPETEELVANVLAQMDEIFDSRDPIDVVDVGTGSGAIAIAIAKEDARVTVLATDISEEALQVAKENATLNQAKIEFMQGSMLQPLITHGRKVDVLISNPPYIPQEELLEKSVKEFEPHVALFGGEDGLVFYKEIIQNCHLVLKEKSFLAFEMGWNQKDALIKMIHSFYPQLNPVVIQDMSGKDRMLFIQWEGGK
ncbi:MAG: peptide chain release factor N(5)-glutamine methyltransferase [Anaerorhabdus sp.]